MSEFNSAISTTPGIEAAAPASSTTDPASANQASAPLSGRRDETDVVLIAEETLSVSKRAIVTGKVRVSTRTEIYDDVAEITLDKNVVEVSRVPVGRVVDVAPSVRIEGDTTVVPVVEERVVVVKQLYLKEELHIRHHVGREVSRTPVQLRRQVAVIERLDENGQVVFEDPATSS